MKIVVTGGAGYIGSVLVRILAERGHDVTVLDRMFFGVEAVEEIGDRATVVKDDIRSCNSDVFRGVEAVFDLASLSNDPAGELDQRKTLEINYKGRVRIATLAKEHGVKRYVLASTCSVYGSSDEVVNESSVLNPLTTYAHANTLAEKEVLNLGDSRFSPTVLRQATVYGLSRRMRFDLAINGMVLAYYKNGKIRIMRDGAQWRPFVHVQDTSKAFVRVLEADRELVKGQVFNVGSNDQNCQIANLARTVAEAMGVTFAYEWYGSPDTRNYRVSFDKINKVLDFKVEHTPADGAREVQAALKRGELDGDDPRTITVEWYKKLLSNPTLASQVSMNGVVF